MTFSFFAKVMVYYEENNDSVLCERGVSKLKRKREENIPRFVYYGMGALAHDAHVIMERKKERTSRGTCG